MDTSKNYDIFISYRRDGGFETAKHLYDLLVRDGYCVSFDIDTLRNGTFDVQLLSRIDQCKDFILVVDKHCFERTLDSSFNPKQDWLHVELAHALKTGKNIIPVFLSGVNGFPEGLPDDIKEVARYNGTFHNNYYFDEFYAKLRDQFLSAKPYSKKKERTKRNITGWGLWNFVFPTLLIVNLFLIADEFTALFFPRTMSSDFLETIMYKAYAFIDFDVLYGVSSVSLDTAVNELHEIAGTNLVLNTASLAVAVFGRKSLDKKTQIGLYVLATILCLLFFARLNVN